MSTIVVNLSDLELSTSTVNFSRKIQSSFLTQCTVFVFQVILKINPIIFISPL